MSQARVAGPTIATEPGRRCIVVYRAPVVVSTRRMLAGSDPPDGLRLRCSARMREGFMRLAGNAALVTGGSHGIGRATALALAREGADIALTYRRREEGVREVAAEIASMGRRVHVMQAELSERERCAPVVDEALQALGQLDILINN